MIKLRFLRNNQGVTIVQTMVAGSMLALVAAGVMQITRQYFRSEKRSNVLKEVERASFEIDSLFRDGKVCRSTLLGKNPVTGEAVTDIRREIGIENIKVDEGPSINLDPSEIASYNALPKNIIYKMDCPAGGTPAQTDPCSVGKGTTSKILLHSAKISKYNPSDNTATLEYSIRVASAVGKDLTTFQDIALLGAKEFVKKINLLVSVDNNNVITNCVTRLENYFDENCEVMLSGVLDKSGALKCKNIVIDSNGPGNAYPDPAHKYAITVVDSLQTNGSPLATGSIKISKFADINSTIIGGLPAGSPMDGALRLQGSFGNKNNYTQATGSILFGPYNAEVLKLSNPSNGALMVSGKTDLTFAKLELGNTSYMHGIGNLLGIQTAPTVPFNKTVGVNGSMEVSGDMTVDGVTTLNGNLTLGNTETLDVVGGRLQLSNLRVEIASPFNQSDSSPYVATRHWVYNLFDNRLGNVAINAFFNELIEFAPASGLTSLRQSFCNRIISPHTGTGGAPNGCTSHASQTCAADEGMKGYTAAGNIICAKKATTTNCQVGMGINSSGGLNCGSEAANLSPYIAGMLI
jgi:hypothetical protein